MPPGVVVELAPHDPITSGVLYCGLPDWPEMPFLLDYLQPGDRFVDVGANVGLYTLLAASVPNVQVVAFEPNQASRQRAIANASLNHMLDRVVVRAEAVADVRGTAEFTAMLGPQNRFADEGVEDADAVHKVDVVTLDDCIHGSVALLKVDVEGAEVSVLRGGMRILRTSMPALILEANDPAKLTALLGQFGYQWISYDPACRDLRSAPIPEPGANGIAVVNLDQAASRIGRG